MKKIIKVGIALLAAMAVLTVVGCPVTVEELNSGVGISSITIAGVTTDDIPAGVPRSEWLSVGFSPAGMGEARLILADPSDLADAVISITLADDSAGATVFFAFSASGLLPDESDWTTNNTFNLVHNSFIYIQVTAENYDAQAYYRVHISSLNDVAGIFSLRIAGINTGVFYTDGSPDLNNVVLGTLFSGIPFGEEITDALVEVDRQDDLATLRFARVPAGSGAAPVFSDSAVIPALGLFDIVYVEVTPSDGGAPMFYGARVLTNAAPNFTLGIRGVNLANIGLGAYSPDAAVPIAINRNVGAAGMLAAVGSALEADISYALNPGAGSISWLPLAAPLTWNDSRAEQPNRLYIRAIFDDSPPIYYIINITMQAANRDIARITFGGAAGIGTLGTGAATIPAGLPWAPGSIPVAARGAMFVPVSNLPIVVEMEDEAAQLTGYVIMPAGGNPTMAAHTQTGASAITDLGGGRFQFDNAGTAIAAGQHLHLRVEAENGTTHFHRIVTTPNNIATLSGLTVGGVTATLGAGGAAVNVAEDNRGTLSLTPAQAAEGVIAVVGTPTSTIANVTGWALVGGAVDSPTLTAVTTNSFDLTGPVTNGQHLFVQVTAGDSTTRHYYRINILIQSDNRNIARITFDDVAGIGTFGAGGATIPGFGGIAAANRGAMFVPVSNLPIVVEMEDEGAQLTGFVIAAAATNPNAAAHDQPDGAIIDLGSGRFQFDNAGTAIAAGQHLHLRVEAENGTAHFHRIVTTLDNIATLSSLTVGGVTATLGAGGAAVNVEEDGRGTLSLTSAQAAEGVIAVVGTPTSTIANVTGWALADGAADSPTLTAVTTDSFDLTGPITNDQHLFIQVTAGDSVTRHYYRVVVTVYP